MNFSFDGQSWAIGALSACVYFDAISAWWLLFIPFLLLRYGVYKYEFTWRRTN